MKIVPKASLISLCLLIFFGTSTSAADAQSLSSAPQPSAEIQALTKALAPDRCKRARLGAGSEKEHCQIKSSMGISTNFFEDAILQLSEVKMQMEPSTSRRSGTSSEDGCLFVATSSKTRKVRNVMARPNASLMVDVRKAGAERGATAVCRVEIISGDRSHEINRHLHSRYLSAAAMSDPYVGPVFASFDDVTLRLTPVLWIAWDMAELDAQALGGRLAKTKGYMLLLD